MMFLALPAGTFRPVIDRAFAFTTDDMNAAHGYMESNASTGKIVVAVAPDA